MKGFKRITAKGATIRFQYYANQAPATCAAFAGLLPFSRLFYHARVSGR
jgi:hypothetical protein